MKRTMKTQPHISFIVGILLLAVFPAIVRGQGLDLTGQNPIPWQSDAATAFSDVNGWNQPQYGSTIMFGDINGDGLPDVCGRGAQGIYCALALPNGQGFGVAKLVQLKPDFSDNDGWGSQPYYYGSIRLANVEGGQFLGVAFLDICGRGIQGIYCAFNNKDGTFAAAKWVSADFSDSQGWNHPEYGSTIMFGDINGDGHADVCGRGIKGIYCALWNPDKHGFDPAYLAVAFFSDNNQWNASASYYGSLRLADVEATHGRFLDICGRGTAGISCALNKKTKNGKFGVVKLWNSDFSDDQGWGQPEYGSTIMFGRFSTSMSLPDQPSVPVDADVCGRRADGVYCASSTKYGFFPSYGIGGAFSDADGWNQASYYGSLRFTRYVTGSVGADPRAHICGRGIVGILCTP